MKKSKFFLYLLPVLIIAPLMACTTPRGGYKPITLEREPAKVQPAEEAAAKAPKRPGYEELKLPAYQKSASEKSLPGREPIDFNSLPLPKGYVTFNVEKMPLSAFIIYALGETLQIPFVMDEKTMAGKQTVNLRMPQAIPPEKALELVIGILEKNNLYVEQQAGALYILQKRPDPKSPADVRVGRDVPESPSDILQVVPLRYIRSSDVEPLIKDMYKTGVQIKPYAKENVLLLYGQATQIRQIMELIGTFDIPTLQDKRLFLLRLTYWQAEEFVTQITRVLEGIGYGVAKAPREPGPLFLAIKQLNAVLVVSPDDATSQYILSWKEKLDSPEAAGAEEKAYTYIPLYSRASELAGSLQNLYGISRGTDASQRNEPLPAASRPGAAAPARSQQATLPSGLRIAADDTKNIIMIIAPPSVYRDLLTLLRNLDKPTKQVLIEATIAELTLTDDLKYGVEWFLRNRWGSGNYGVGTSGSFGVNKILGLGFSYVTDLGNFQTLIAALATENRANILSTPRLTVLDNREAVIQVGEDIPIVTGEITGADLPTAGTGTQPSILRNIQYRSTGVILKVKPTINTEGLLTLEINQEVSIPGAEGAGGSPIILTRKISTAVVVGHGQTVALGGLIKETVTESVSKVPLLGDIPLIGHLFKSTGKSKVKTELIILVTPTILTSTDDAAKITQELRKELKWFK